MHNRVISRLGTALVVIVMAPAALAAGLGPVRLGAQALSAGQIRTISLQRLESTRDVTAYGIVLGPERLVTLVSEVVAARSVLAAARARAVLAREEASRAERLYHARRNISEAALQRAQSALAVAQSAQLSAAATLGQLKSRLLAQWGPQFSRSTGARSAPLSTLESGTDVLVEVSLPFGRIVRNPPEVASAATPSGDDVQLHLISRAPRTAAGVSGESLFYMMSTRVSAPIGTPLAVRLITSVPAAGVRVPRSAVVWYHGDLFVFRETAPGLFAPIPIRGVFPSAGGYFVPEDRHNPLRPGERIAVRGAALLYSAATQSSPPSTGEPARTPADGGH